MFSFLGQNLWEQSLHLVDLDLSFLLGLFSNFCMKNLKYFEKWFSSLLTSNFSSFSSKLVSSSKLRLRFGLSLRQWIVPYIIWILSIFVIIIIYQSQYRNRASVSHIFLLVWTVWILVINIANIPCCPQPEWWVQTRWRQLCWGSLLRRTQPFACAKVFKALDWTGEICNNLILVS